MKQGRCFTRSGTPVRPLRASIDAATGEPAEAGIVLALPANGTRIRVLDIPPDDPSLAEMTPERPRPILPKLERPVHLRTKAQVRATRTCIELKRSITA